MEEQEVEPAQNHNQPVDTAFGPRPACRRPEPPDRESKDTPMKKIELAAVIASGVAAAILGLGSPAQAVDGGDAPAVLHAAPETKIGIDHLNWLDDIRPKVNVPDVDTNVQHREIVLPLPS
jgi:hypothetical protein